MANFLTEVTGLHDFRCLYPLHVASSSLTPLQGLPLRANARPRRTVWLKNGTGTQNSKENASFWTHMVEDGSLLVT